MASRSRAGRSSCFATTCESSESMPRRQRPNVSSIRSFTQVGDLERTIGALDEPLHARFHLAQLLGRRAQAGDALLEQGERPLELDLLGLELSDNLLQSTELLLEAHFDSGGCASVTRAAIAPSRSTRSNGMSLWNDVADVSAW